MCFLAGQSKDREMRCVSAGPNVHMFARDIFKINLNNDTICIRTECFVLTMQAPIIVPQFAPVSGSVLGTDTYHCYLRVQYGSDIYIGMPTLDEWRNISNVQFRRWLAIASIHDMAEVIRAAFDNDPRGHEEPLACLTLNLRVRAKLRGSGEIIPIMIQVPCKRYNLPGDLPMFMQVIANKMKDTIAQAVSAQSIAERNHCRHRLDIFNCEMFFMMNYNVSAIHNIA